MTARSPVKNRLVAAGRVDSTPLDSKPDPAGGDRPRQEQAGGDGPERASGKPPCPEQANGDQPGQKQAAGGDRLGGQERVSGPARSRAGRHTCGLTAQG